MQDPSAYRLHHVCILSAHSLGKEKVYAEAAKHLGEVLSKEKLHVIYGGGSVGLMGCVAATVHVRGGHVLGIIPTPMKPLLKNSIGKEMVVPDLHERSMQMIYQSDAFIALPGGLCALDDIFHIVNRAQLNIHQKPIGLLNINNFFDGLLSFLDSAVEKGFILPVTRKIIISASTAEELIAKFRAFNHSPHPTALAIDWSAGGSKKRCLDVSLHL